MCIRDRAYRNISSQLIDFNSKYLRLTAPNSLYRASTFDRSIITSQGSNASKVKVSGSSAVLDGLKDVYKRQALKCQVVQEVIWHLVLPFAGILCQKQSETNGFVFCGRSA